MIANEIIEKEKRGKEDEMIERIIEIEKGVLEKLKQKNE